MISKSTAWAIVSACGALSAAMILTVLLVSGHETALAVTGTTDPVTGQVNQMAIDMVTTGNSPGTGTTGTTVTLLGPVDTVLANVPLNSTVVVDVIVDEIAPADGNATGFGFDLHYNPAIVSINGHTSTFMVSAGLEPGVVPDPDSSGDWRDDYVTFGNGTHLGEGVLTEVGIACGSTIGSSALTLTNGDVFTRTNTNGDPTLPINPGSLGNATIYCGEPAGGSATPTPSPTLSPTGTGPTPSPSPTPSPTGTGPTPSPSPTLSPTGTGPTPSPTLTHSPTPSPSPTHTATATPTNTAAATTPAVTHTPTATPTPTPTPSVGGATTAAHSTTGTPTPAALPKTGGSSGDGNSMATFLLMLALGGALVVTAGSVVYARAGRKE